MKALTIGQSRFICSLLDDAYLVVLCMTMSQIPHNIQYCGSDSDSDY